MVLPDAAVVSAVPTMRTLSLQRPRPGVFRMTSMLSAESYSSDTDPKKIAAQLQFPGVPPKDFAVRRFDAARGIIDIEFTPAPENTMMRRWLDSLEVGSRTRIAGHGTDHLPNFASGRRVHLFADESSVSAVHSILERWPSTARGLVWIDTPDPAHVAALPVVDGVGVIGFHVEMGFDPLVTAARRVELDTTTTVWAAGERQRMASIRATCLAAGLTDDDTRVFGFWSRKTPRTR